MIHIGDGGADFESGGGADFGECGSEAVGFGGGFHECTGAAFDIEGDVVGSARDFLAEDAADDEREAGDGSGDIAEGVEGFIGGGEAGSLSGESNSDVVGLSFHLLGGEIGSESGDAGEFIDGSAGFAESGAGHFDNC